GQESLGVLLAEGVRSVVSTPLQSGDGRVLGMMSTHFARLQKLGKRQLDLLDLLARQAADYLAHKAGETELRTTAQQLSVVTDGLSVPVARASRDLRYLWVSKPYGAWIGRSVEDIIGKPIVEVLGPDAFAQLLPGFQQVLRGELDRYEVRVPLPGLESRWVSAPYTPTFDAAGACDGWIAVVIDVDARRRSEEALEIAAQRKDEFLAMLGHELRNPLAA